MEGPFQSDLPGLSECGFRVKVECLAGPEEGGKKFPGLPQEAIVEKGAVCRDFRADIEGSST